ncbi:hypothetical protein ACO2Q0_00885 [Phenylobacterium sp. VNQ135]|uniref:hypothetical protein n=1 Tax=Phenylobacterium sp. VNQ135 TaxID=3400922 RepID=UPI003BFC06E9
MPGTSFESDADFDPQDQAEAFDESMTVGGEGSVALGGDSPLAVGEEMRTFEELPDVEDLTQLMGDRDDDEAVALDADEFDPDAVDDRDFEEDNELDYHAATEEHEDDLDGLGPDDGFNDHRVLRSEIDGLDEVRDADEAEGGEDDFTDFQARDVSDADLKDMGYSEDRGGETRAKPDD